MTIEKCDGRSCKGFGKFMVDRGYGYPVCPSNKWTLNPKPMDSRYDGQYSEN